jgi:hypothetical protein
MMVLVVRATLAGRLTALTVKVVKEAQWPVVMIATPRQQQEEQ